MEIVCCEKNHFYDAERYSFCPQCAAEAQAGGASRCTPTEPIGPTEPVGPTVPSGPVEHMGAGFGTVGATIPVSNPSFTPEPTAAVPRGNIAGINPVVGWLVCVDGADRGSDYRIHDGNNYLGRDQSMDICIRSDEHISRINAAIIGYDNVERQFFFGPAGGHNTVRVNGKMVINAVALAPYDEITVGMTKLMFVPLCGERFAWNGK